MIKKLSCLLATLFGFTAACRQDPPNDRLILILRATSTAALIGVSGRVLMDPDNPLACPTLFGFRHPGWTRVNPMDPVRLPLPSHSGDESDSGRGNAVYRRLFTRSALHPDPAQHPLRDECRSFWNGIRQQVGAG